MIRYIVMTGRGKPLPILSNVISGRGKPLPIVSFSSGRGKPLPIVSITSGRGKSLPILSILFFFSILFCPKAITQTSDPDQFRVQYDSLILSDKDADTALVNANVKKLLSINQQHEGLYDSLVTSMLIWHYNWKSKYVSEDERLPLLQSYRAILEKMKKPFHADFARFYGLYIHVFWYNYQTDSIEKYLDLIEQHINAEPKPLKAKIQWLYEKGRYAVLMDDYEAALPFAQRGLEYLEENFPDQLRMKYLLLNAIGIAYRRMGYIDEAIAHYEKLVGPLMEEANASNMTGAFLNNLGLAYKDCGDYSNAIHRLTDAIEYYQENISPSFYDIGTGYDNIAICYQNEGKLDSAFLFSKKSLDFISENMGTSHPDLLLPMCSMMNTLILKEDFQGALALNVKAKSLLKELGWRPDNPEGDYYLADGFDVFAYGRQIERALFEKTSDTTYLSHAIEDGAYFMAMTDYAYDNLKNDLSKEIFQLKRAAVFSGCVDDLYNLYQISHDASLIEQAFAITEKFKSLELLYAAQKDKADQVETYKVLNQQYTDQVDSIKYYETLTKADDPDRSKQAEVLSKYNGFKEELYLWKERTKKDYPDYYQLIYHPVPLTLVELQHALTGSDQCILSYHVSSDAVYMFVITPGEIYFVKNESRVDLPDLISEFRRSIDGYFTNSTRSESGYALLADRFAHSAASLYKILVAPVDTFLVKRVVIIVDKSLGYIPFVLLAKNAPTVTWHYRLYNYLLKHYAISYSYSARLWMDMRQHEKTFSEFRMLAIAPDFPEAGANKSNISTRSGFQRLFFNEKEVKDLHKVIHGKLLIGAHATKKNFISNCSHYPIVHLATHSKANDEEGDYSFLAFTDTGKGNAKLSAGEIYDLDLNAELVTLSACETGLGELKSGEGIISLARAFSFAGAKSIVSSLWSVNDKSTPTIMTSFYQNIKNGTPKDVALQEAKMDFILSRDHVDAHPFYWGSFICVGDMRPVEITDHHLPIGILVVFGMAALIILYFLLKNFFSLGTTR